MLDLTSPRVHARNAYYDKQLELDAATFTRSTDTLERALQGGKQLTRTELEGKLSEIGFVAGGGSSVT
jgi:hypothetical protein